MKFLVIVGSYSKIIYGIDVDVKRSKVQDEVEVETQVAFAFPAHEGLIRSVASCSNFLVSGGNDESLR
jgi:hypothetical protein